MLRVDVSTIQLWIRQALKAICLLLVLLLLLLLLLLLVLLLVLLHGRLELQL
jgi:hypothetical protein